MTKVVVIAGLSGAGRSVAAGALEDHGWFVMDNLPAALVARVGALALSVGNDYEQICLVISGYDAEMSDQIDALREQVDDFVLVFLEASTETLVRRFKATKRRHPFGVEQGLSAAISQERSDLQKARAAADLIIDTSDLNPYQLRDRLTTQVIDSDTSNSGNLKLSLVSFGFKNGVPRDIDLVFDCRFMPNPYWESELREFSGQEKNIQEYVFAPEVSKKFIDQVHHMLVTLLPAYITEGKSYLTVAFGCTGGRHRSVAVAEKIRSLLDADNWPARVMHRDIERH